MHRLLVTTASRAQIRETAASKKAEQTPAWIEPDLVTGMLDYIEILERRGCTGDKAVLWAVHVRGPDDVLPAPDYDTAVAWADLCLTWDRKEGRTENDPLLSAVVAEWKGTPENHAALLEESKIYFEGSNGGGARSPCAGR